MSSIAKASDSVTLKDDDDSAVAKEKNNKNNKGKNKGKNKGEDKGASGEDGEVASQSKTKEGCEILPKASKTLFGTSYEPFIGI